MFEEAYERCRIAPMEGVPFTLEDFQSALEKYDFNSEIGTKVTSFILIGFFFRSSRVSVSWTLCLSTSLFRIGENWQVT